MMGSDLCHFLVSSQSDTGKEYVVNICLHEIGLDADGNMDYNGACLETRTESEFSPHGCEHFRYKCEPKLKDPNNMGKVFRCAHIRAARDQAFKIMLPHLAKTNLNIPDNQMP